MKNLLIVLTLAVVSLSAVLIFLEVKENLEIQERIELKKLQELQREQQYQKDLDKLNFDIKRQEMLDVYEGVRGFESQCIFWDTISFIKVEKQF